MTHPYIIVANKVQAELCTQFPDLVIEKQYLPITDMEVGPTFTGIMLTPSDVQRTRENRGEFRDVVAIHVTYQTHLESLDSASVEEALNQSQDIFDFLCKDTFGDWDFHRNAEQSQQPVYGMDGLHRTNLFQSFNELVYLRHVERANL